MEKDYTNREVTHYFDEMKNLINSRLNEQDKTLNRIENQVTKTNGRVTVLEFWKEGLVAKASGIMFAIGIGWIAIKELIIKR